MNLPRNAQLWAAGYARNRLRHLLRRRKPKRLWVAITDHYEPLGRAEMPQALARVAAWQRRWPEIAATAPRDADHRPPRYTFFYPQEEYRPELIAPLAEFARAGIGDVEVHLHHDDETAAAFREKITTFCRELHERHGLLRRRDGQVVFGFIHGNWALDNSRPDGRWCGLTGEIGLLRELGCYADFTMPSLPSPTQARIINQIYWTTGPLDRPRSFDQGVPAEPGRGRRGELLMIPGPLGRRYRGRLVPRLETGEIAGYDRPTPYRVQRWLDLAPQVGDDLFVKLYTHGAREDNAAALLGAGAADEGGLLQMFRWLHQAAAERSLELRWASAYEMFQAVERITSPGSTPAATKTSGETNGTGADRPGSLDSEAVAVNAAAQSNAR